MPTMSLANKALSVLVAGLLVSGESFATDPPRGRWVTNESGTITLRFSDGDAHRLHVPPGVQDAFYDPVKHRMDGNDYVLVFQRARSVVNRPLQACGAGTEVRLSVYQVSTGSLKERGSLLISSCLRTVSLQSQNSGSTQQDTDYSSVYWTAGGFSIDWFNQLNAAGQPISTTHYALQQGMFVPLEVIRAHGAGQ